MHYLAVVEYAENEEDLNEDAQLVILSVGEDDEGEYLDVVEDDEVLLSEDRAGNGNRIKQKAPPEGKSLSGGAVY